LAAGAAILYFFLSLAPVGSREKDAAKGAVYHADPEHLGNRLYAAFFLRKGPDGQPYGQDRLEPLLWAQSRHLLEGRSHRRAVAVLEEFIAEKGEKKLEDPLKRALLQRDLWLVFNWVESDHSGLAGLGLEPQAIREAQQRLRRLLAAVIGRLALSPEEVRSLPDNYAAAAASGEFAKRYSSKRPEQEFLPPDLFAADGPWVCLGRPDGPIAPTHLRDGNLFTNTAFFLFLRLPAGRPATLAYLERLRSFDQPLLVKAEDAGNHFRQFVSNQKLPALPVGTEVALVRRALLITSAHSLLASPLTESVQLRVYREVPKMTVQNLNAALTGGTAANRRAQSWQSFHELRLSRSLLLAGRAGGLRAAETGERDFSTGFGSHGYDEFESPPPVPERPFTEASQHVIKESCFACHSLPGVASFNSYFNFRVSDMQTGRTDGRPFSLVEMPVSRVGAAAVKWKEGQPSWTALRKLLAE
jgi:hypothetical protein